MSEPFSLIQAPSPEYVGTNSGYTLDQNDPRPLTASLVSHCTAVAVSDGNSKTMLHLQGGPAGQIAEKVAYVTAWMRQNYPPEANPAIQLVGERTDTADGLGVREGHTLKHTLGRALKAEGYRSVAVEAAGMSPDRRGDGDRNITLDARGRVTSSSKYPSGNKDHGELGAAAQPEPPALNNPQRTSGGLLERLRGNGQNR